MSSRYIKIPNIKNSDRDTPGMLFQKVLHLVKEHGHYDKIAPIIDYASPEEYDKRELTDYHFDFHPVVAPGGSEGIYLDCSLLGKFDDSDDKQCKIGTFKSLEEGVTGFKLMGELSGLMAHYAHQYLNSHIDRYTPEEQRRREEQATAMPDELVDRFHALFACHPIQTTKLWIAHQLAHSKDRAEWVARFDTLIQAFEAVRERYDPMTAEILYHNVWTTPLKANELIRAADMAASGRLEQFNEDYRAVA